MFTFLGFQQGARTTPSSYLGDLNKFGHQESQKEPRKCLLIFFPSAYKGGANNPVCKQQKSCKIRFYITNWLVLLSSLNNLNPQDQAELNVMYS